MAELEALIAEAHGAWEPRLARALLGTDDPAAVAAALTAAVRAAVDLEVVGARFYAPGVGLVAGLDLADGRAVVAKVHWWQVTPAKLAAVAGVQAALADAGVPAPRPIAGPVRFGKGWLMVDELLAGGEVDGHDPVARRSMAAALHRFVGAAPAPAGDLGSWWLPVVHDGVWPVPHDRRFDLPATRKGAGWIDEAGRDARHRIEADASPVVVGHLDWRVQNLGWDGDEIVAIYDWDSVALVPEGALVGMTSVQHAVDWRRGEADPLPTLEAVDGFVADYEAARGAPFTSAEHDLLAAAQRWLAAYGARCQHSDDVLGLFPDVDHSLGWPRLLRQLLAR